MDQNIVNFTVNRQKEFNQVLKNLSHNVPTLLLGKAGVGKTHLLFNLREHLNLRKMKYLYLPKFKPVKECLIELFKVLKKNIDEKEEKRIKRMTISELTAEVTLLLEKKNRRRKKTYFILIFDHLEEITTSTADILGKLSTLALVFGAGRYVREVRALKRFFWQFETIEILPFDKEDSIKLVNILVEQKNLKVKCKKFFINHVTANTSGIPLSIIETINRAAKRTTITRSYVREMFIHGSGVKEVDASPFIILIFAFFIVMRFVYRGFGEYQGYALFGALSGIGIFIRYMLYRQARGKRG
ncbi:MAG: ATP-binding protein [Candidatus Omnitrophota bacterium]